jgi:AraC-like DNA-binding protein
LSASYFTRAFRQSLGTAPHQWLLRLRVERAKEQLLNSDASLADIAVGCGFADQSHFTRVFAKQIGVGPRAMAALKRTRADPWRRQLIARNSSSFVRLVALSRPSVWVHGGRAMELAGGRRWSSIIVSEWRPF